jgi:hypothetical protein
MFKHFFTCIWNWLIGATVPKALPEVLIPDNVEDNYLEDLISLQTRIVPQKNRKSFSVYSGESPRSR